jgi:acetylornithine deacetylase/succinyl-diaminopimelate desuccinylase-like protein
VEIVETAELPVIFGLIDEGAQNTLLLHGLYDVTPADEPAWIIPPFKPEVLDVKGVGPSIIGRGAEDMKTPIAAAMNVIASYRAVGRPLPVNIMLVFEASELGSGGIREFVPSYIEELRSADAVLWLCPLAHPNGVPIVPLAVKGNLMGRLICRGGNWGGPIDNEMHALNSNWVGNPAVRLSQALTLIENRLEDSYINGRIWQTTPTQRQLAGKLASRLDPEQIKASLGICRFRYDDFEQAVDAHLFRTQFTVTGLQSGFIGDGKSVKVSIPSDAQAIVNMRFQPGQSPVAGIAEIRSILDDGSFDDIVFEVNNAYAGGGSPPDHPLVKSLLGAHRAMGADPEVWPVHPIAIPVALWTEDVGLPWVGGVPCHAGNKHAANEYAQVDGIRYSEKFFVQFMERFGAVDL